MPIKMKLIINLYLILDTLLLSIIKPEYIEIEWQKIKDKFQKLYIYDNFLIYFEKNYVN